MGQIVRFRLFGTNRRRSEVVGVGEVVLTSVSE